MLQPWPFVSGWPSRNLATYTVHAVDHGPSLSSLPAAFAAVQTGLGLALEHRYLNSAMLLEGIAYTEDFRPAKQVTAAGPGALGGHRRPARTYDYALPLVGFAGGLSAPCGMATAAGEASTDLATVVHQTHHHYAVAALGTVRLADLLRKNAGAGLDASMSRRWPSWMHPSRNLFPWPHRFR